MWCQAILHFYLHANLARHKGLVYAVSPAFLQNVVLYAEVPCVNPIWMVLCLMIAS